MASIQRQGVLVVDDAADLRLLVRRLLEPLHYDIREAANAAEAEAIAADERPALVLLDVHLPDISGYELCHRFRAEYGEDVAIVFLSGERTEEFDRTAGMLLGADDYIVKPFAAGEFIARVRRAIARSSPPRDATSTLTARELEVLKLLAQGLGQKKIAQALFITPKTVATHIQRILGKLGVHSRAEAVAYAHKSRMFESNGGGYGRTGSATGSV